MPPDDALRLKLGRGLLGAEMEAPDCERRWCRAVDSVACACWASWTCWAALLSLFRFLPNEVFRWTRWPTTWRWALCWTGREWPSDGDWEMCDCDDDWRDMAVGLLDRE